MRAGLACLALAGCSGYERAELSLARSAARGEAAAERIEPNPATMVLDRSDATARAALGLLQSALRLVAASGRPLPAAEAEGLDPREAYCVVRIEHGNCLGEDVWRIGANCALRELAGGALLAWRGEFAQVLGALELLLPPRAPAGSGSRSEPDRRP